MGVRVKDYSTNAPTNGWEPTEYQDSTITQRETTVDGQTFHWAPNQVRNFLDDGVGLNHAAFAPGAMGDTQVSDRIPFNNARS